MRTKKAKANTLSFSMAVLRFSDIIYIVYLYQNKHSLISEEEKKSKKNPLSLFLLYNTQFSIRLFQTSDSEVGEFLFFCVFKKKKKKKRGGITMVNPMDHRNIAANIFTYSTTDLTAAAALQPRTCACVIHIAEQNKMNLFSFRFKKQTKRGRSRSCRK
jgi:hypothetical protein